MIKNKPKKGRKNNQEQTKKRGEKTIKNKPKKGEKKQSRTNQKKGEKTI
jgi:hypothetical protein